MINNKNIAYIDGQNLYGGTSETEPKWSIDYKKFRRYLSEKYNVNVAYYYLGFKDEKYQSLYDGLEEAGFELRFREHSASMISNKKGSVDTDIVFDIMYSFIKSKCRRKVVLVSGDGDYIKTVRFLMGENLLEKVLLPNRHYASSLYRQLPSDKYDYLDNSSVRRKIEYVRKGK